MPSLGTILHGPDLRKLVIPNVSVKNDDVNVVTNKIGSAAIILIASSLLNKLLKKMYDNKMNVGKLSMNGSRKKNINIIQKLCCTFL